MTDTNTTSLVGSIMEQTIQPPQDQVLNPGSTTNFVNDAAQVTVSTLKDPYDISRMFNANLAVYTEQDIKEFVRKPIALANGTFATTDSASGVKETYDLYQLFLNNDMIQQKIKGHLAWRGKFVVRIVINGNRFQQGRYFLAFFPTAGAVTTNQATPWLNMHIATLTQRSQLPKIEFDINRDTEAVFEVPFISAYSHMLVSTSDIVYTKPGIFLLCTYAPLVAPTGSTTASYTIYGHMEDFELQTPTVPQSRVNFKSSKKNSKSSSGADHQTNEQKQANLGPISSTLTKVSQAADIVAQVPMLSAIAAPVSWFADIAANVASVFGWSNPLDLSEVTRAIQTIIPYANNVDMPDAAMPLSLYARNMIEILPGIGGTDIDEMSIDHIKTIPAYYRSFNITTTDAIGTAVFIDDANPLLYYSTITDNARTVYGYSPVSYLAQFFSYYRGGLVFTFKVVSTEFHSGRYQIGFLPFDSYFYDGPLPTYDTSAYLHREIIDLREGNEFTFHIPYTSIENYRSLISDKGAAFGTIAIFPVNPLTAPASVSTVVKVLIEVAAAPDFEYAALRGNTLSITTPSAPQSNVSFPSKTTEITSGTIGNANLLNDNHLNSRHCIGERVHSLLAVLKHNNQLIPVTQGTTAAAAYISPFGINTTGFVGSVNNDSPFRPDLYSMITSMYAMSRGAVRWKIFNNSVVESSTNERTSTTVGYFFTGVSAFIGEQTTAIASTRWALSVIQNSIYRGCVDVQTPPYHNTFARTNVNEFVGNGETFVKTLSDASANPMILQVNTATATGNLYFRQVADDFQLSCFISVPACVVR